jgi:hypothetical protein
MAKGFSEASISPKKSSKCSFKISAVDCEQIQKQLFEHFEELIDPREKQGNIIKCLLLLDLLDRH